VEPACVELPLLLLVALASDCGSVESFDGDVVVAAPPVVVLVLEFIVPVCDPLAAPVCDPEALGVAEAAPVWSLLLGVDEVEELPFWLAVADVPFGVAVADAVPFGLEAVEVPFGLVAVAPVELCPF